MQPAIARLKRISKLRWLLLCVVLWLPPLDPVDSLAADEAEVARLTDAVMEEWKARCRNIKTAIVDWTETHNTPFFPDGRAKVILKQKSRLRFVVSGRRWKFVMEGMLWSSSAEAVIPNEKVYAFDGRHYYSFVRSAGHPQRPYPKGAIEANGGRLHTRHPSARPVLMELRAFDPSIGVVDERRWLQQPATVSRTRDGGRELGIPFRSYPQGEVIDYFFTGEPGWQISRIGWHRTMSLDVSRGEAETDSRLRGWTYGRHAAGDDPAQAYIKARVVAWRENIPISDDTFKLDFPPGTVMTEPSTRPGQMWVVRRNGSRRAVTKAEREHGVDLARLSKLEAEADGATNDQP